MPLRAYIHFLPVCFIACAAMAEERLGLDESASPSTTVNKVQRVEVLGHKDDRRSSTATKTVILEADIVRYGDSSLVDVLKRVPGISVRGVQGKGGQVRMRGLGSGYTQVMLNGERAPPGFSLDSISPELIERIEVARAATADASTQAIAGSINIILKRKVDMSRRDIKLAASSDGGEPGIAVDGLLSDRDSGFSYTISGGIGRSKSVDVSHVDQEERNTEAVLSLARLTQKRDFGQSDRLNLAPRLMWDLGHGNSINLESLLRFQHSEGGGEELRLTGLGEPPPLVRDFTRSVSDSSQFRSKLSVLHQLASGAKLDLKLGVTYNRREAESQLEGFDVKDLPALSRNITSLASDYGFSLSGKYMHAYVEGHSFVIGWEGEYNWRAEDKLRQETASGRPSIYRDDSYTAKVERLAVFAQDEWEILPQWSLYMGLRWEEIATQSEGNTMDEVSNRSSVLSPILQTLWKLAEKDQLRFALSRTYKAPNTRDLIPRRNVANDNSSTTPDTKGNPNLRPELAWGVDLAFEHYLEKGGVLSASIYARQIDDVILPSLMKINGKWVSQPFNQGRALLHGAELEAKFNVKQYWSDAPALDLRANVAANWSEVESIAGPDNRLDQQTPISANFGVDYKLPGDALTLGGNYNFQSAATTRLSNTQTAINPAKRTLDLYGVWKINSAMQLRISFANILAEDHIAESTYADRNGIRQQTTTSQSEMTARAVLEMRL
ncbi:TonB-dependent receptor plug domain-containing protein [Iodobacter arcticus]|uniref:TonB-dependent receptor plug domain-containing protein n=1 Tax=Iodobacter arcticus TaxID=590593 RepID=A0ABW2QVV1_9NEIS